MTSGRVGQQGRRIDYLAALTVARQFLAELSAVSELRGTDFQFDKVSELKTLAEIIHCISCIFFLSSLHDMHKASLLISFIIHANYFSMLIRSIL